jgi:ketosteroid isomerase-like protein
MRVLQEVDQMVGEAVAENNRRFAAAAAAGDARAIASVYADEAELLPPNAEALRGQEAIERFWEAGIEMGIRGIELETMQLEQTNGFAYEVGRYKLRFEIDEGPPSVEVGKYVVVHMRYQDGSWRRAVEIFNWDVSVR